MQIMSERIAVVSCGGTIAMTPSGDKGSLAPELSGEQLIAQVPNLGEMGVDIDVIELFNKDSTNVGPADWKALTDKLAAIQSEYDGIVVTHGTDTMANTATATSLALGQELAVPVVFTGSQLPIKGRRTDAVVNLESAMEVTLAAARQGISETMIVFSHRVLRAARTIKTSESKFDAFDSPAFPHLADLTAEEEITFSPNARVNRNVGFGVNPRNTFDRGILVADADATTHPEIVLAASLSPKCTGLILRSVGAGNVPSEGIDSFVPVIEQTLEANKPVIIASRFVGGRTTPEKYQPGQAAIEAGAGHSGNMTDVAAKVKLMWLMGQGIREPEKVSKAMLTPVVGEVDVQ